MTIKQRSYGFLITKEQIFGFQILDLKDHFSASLRQLLQRNICSITCFDALSYLCEYVLELLELSQSIWFSFYQYAFYFCILSRVHSIRTSFISSVAIKDLIHLLEKFSSC